MRKFEIQSYALLWLLISVSPGLAQSGSLSEVETLMQQATSMPDGSPELRGIVDKAASKVLLLKSDKNLSAQDMISLQATIGQLYQNLEQPKESLVWWQKVVSSDENDWRAWAKIAQCCQALSDHPQRNKAREHVLQLAKNGKVEQPMFCIEQFKNRTNPVMVMEYWNHNAANPNSRDKVFYSFIVLAPDHKSTVLRYVLTELATDTSFGRETQSLGPDEHRYSVDRYQKGSVGLITMFNGKEPPGYDKVKAVVLTDLDKQTR
ncbi:MAG: hypothetical protein JST89_04160 [Cyanobacteria bacterium SZAS-4]|nr:hypothetical protein [Cyanobacteria bacterium SZAS-4]